MTLALRDVETAFGSGPLTVLVDDHESLTSQLVSRGYGVPDPDIAGYVIRTDHSAIGIWVPMNEEWPNLVVRVAEILQEGIIEGPEHWVAAFARCTTHRSHPIDPRVVDGVAPHGSVQRGQQIPLPLARWSPFCRRRT